MPQCRVGTVFDRKSLEAGERLQEWLRWTPLGNAACKECKLLPSCTGACAHKFVNRNQTRGEAASLPCPSWKYQIKERLLTYALRTGIVRPEDCNLKDAITDPAEICPDLDPARAASQSAGANLVQLGASSLVNMAVSPPGEDHAVHC